jgi:Zn-dependent metalloprotease
MTDPGTATGGVRGIVPPHLLESLARNGTGDARDSAERALEHSRRLAAQRRARRGRSRGTYSMMAAATPPEDREIYDARNGNDLPGDLVRAEGAPAVADAAVNEVYDGFGWTWLLYWEVFGRNSFDNDGSALIGSVHYQQKLDNAAWDGTEMYFGDGDGEYFKRFTLAVDVMGHELTHGVTSTESNLTYEGQSGALNESLSDVFGAMVKQYAQDPKQTAADADWLIGAGLFTAKVSGVALRSMKAPGTAYDDPVLGKDPQPADMSGYVDTTDDSGGVHINSGIPNRAFYLTAVALGGHAWHQAGKIWYAAMTDSALPADSDFATFASMTADHATSLFGATERQAVVDAWATVGVTVAAQGAGGDPPPEA